MRRVTEGIKKKREMEERERKVREERDGRKEGRKRKT